MFPPGTSRLPIVSRGAVQKSSLRTSFSENQPLRAMKLPPTAPRIVPFSPHCNSDPARGKDEERLCYFRNIHPQQQPNRVEKFTRQEALSKEEQRLTRLLPGW